jgi:hypothetical protein
VGLRRARAKRTRSLARLGYLLMSPTWIWLQGAIIVFVLIGMIIAITKLA